MPAKSAKQYGLMQAAKAGRLSGIGPSPSVAEEFIDATPKAKRQKFAKALAVKRNCKSC